MIVPLLSCFFLFSCKDNKDITTTTKTIIPTKTITTTGEQAVYYTVTFMNYDDSILTTVKVLKGDSAIYDLDTPIKPSDDEFDYEFSGWDKDLNNIVSDLYVKAEFKTKSKVDWSDIEWF